MRASFLISRRKPWRGQLLLMARSKALPLLLKLYRRTPIFRPRHLQRRIPICSRGPDGVGRTNPPTDDIALSCRISKSISLGGLVQLDVSGEDEEEFVEDEDILQDLQDLRRQGNLELALMAGEQLEMDSEEDGELDDYDDYWDREGYMQYVAFAECGGRTIDCRSGSRGISGLKTPMAL
ncbi:uncharacterized protein LOC108088805 [Drosophila ficusphila]|uniref:uncharacterized protein LOC108088805 n=1 Tax=Drosophila ficusphila TaxID=30025 RepID=UPI001C8AFF78|nr:uncharacterized protein LOC108088805 [Drosophila ficusphila]